MSRHPNSKAMFIPSRAATERERQYSATKGGEHPPKELPPDWLAEVRRRRRAAT